VLSKLLKYDPAKLVPQGLEVGYPFVILFVKIAVELE